MMDIPLRFGLKREEAEVVRKKLGREPNIVEWGIIALNWSEHCSYKSSKLLLKELPKESKRTVFTRGENAGVLDIGNGYVVSFKVESHNHPSAVEPFHGAATGIGGIVRDVLATGARPIALLDSLHFGPLDDERARWHFDGVVRGISFYGNSIGVPTVGGEVYFEECYRDNPIVNVMCVGVGRREEVKRAVLRGVSNLLVLVGAPTGRDGIHGATFASEDLKGEVEEKIPNVQIGDPFFGKLLIETIMDVVDDPAVMGIQDLGAGGLSTAPAEMAYKGGVGVELDISKVPMRSRDMTPYEILLSESQERAVLCVEKSHVERVLSKLRKYHLEVAVIGRVIEEKVFRVKNGEDIVAELPLELIFEDVPLRKPERVQKISRERHIKKVKTVNNFDILLGLLSHPTVASKDWVYEQYDYTVGTSTVLTPGIGNSAVLRLKGEKFGLALTIDGNPRFSYLNPFKGAMISLLEGYRNIVATGAEPIGITDCLNFPNPEEEENYGDFVLSVLGLKEAAEKLGLPVVSGNVSFYNQSERMKIYPTVVVGVVGLVEDINKVLTPTFKAEGEIIYLVGKLRGKTGGSLYYDFVRLGLGGEVDEPDFELDLRLKDLLLFLNKEGLLSGASDISEGGLLVALATMAVLSSTGCQLNIQDDPDFLFGEWQTRYIITFREEVGRRIKSLLESYEVPYMCLGRTGGDEIRINNKGLKVERAREAYYGAIRRFMEGH